MTQHLTRIRLAFATVFWQSFAIIALLMELGLYQKLRPWIHHRSGGFRVAAMLVKSPRTLCRAFLWAAVIAVVLDIYVRLVLKPILARWYAPPRDEDQFGAFIAFQMNADESIVSEVLARRRIGRRTETGTLLLTKTQIWFAPNRWDSEPLTTALKEVASLKPVETSDSGWVIGRPSPVVMTLADGTEQTFHVLDPIAVSAWLPQSQA